MTPPTGLLIRSFSLGVATGIRSSLGWAAPGLAGVGPPLSNAGKTFRVLAVTGELVADKLPQTPSRLKPAGLAGRLAAGGGGGRALAKAEGAASIFPILAGAAGAAAGSYGGAAWRSWASKRRPDWQGAIIEDGVGITIAYASCRQA